MIPLYKVYMPDNLPELNEILYSGQLAYGKWGRKFESSVSEYIGNEKFISVNSYNSAVLVAITTLGLKPGDEVIASPMSCLASNQPLVTQNLNIVWADIDPETGTLDPDNVKKKISSKTRAIFHNHHCGYSGYIDEINDIARALGLYIIDDAIEAFGSEYKYKLIGNQDSDITLFSFQTVRLPNTIDGGGIAFNNDELFEKAKLIRDLGIDRSKFRDENGEISNQLDISKPGYGATLNEVSSYIGYIQMGEIKSMINQHKINAEKWNYILQNQTGIKQLRITDGTFPNYWVYGCLVREKIKTIKQFREKGIYASGVHLNNNIYSVFNNKDDLKGVNEFYDRFIALPCGWWVRKEDIC